MHARAESPNGAALMATVHCLIGCGLGEIVGMVISTAAALGNAPSIAISVVLAFVFGYALTIWPVLRAGVGFGRATGIAFASETVSIAIMEAVDNVFVAVVPGALAAGLGDAKFWWSIVLGFAIAFVPAFLANRTLIRRGRGHAVLHSFHAH